MQKVEFRKVIFLKEIIVDFETYIMIISKNIWLLKYETRTLPLPLNEERIIT